MLVQDTQERGKRLRKSEVNNKTHSEVVMLLQHSIWMKNTLRKRAAKVDNYYKNRNKSYGYIDILSL